MIQMHAVDTDKAGEKERELVIAGGREVSVSNPRKVLFPQAGYTKLDLVRYFLAVADGALRAGADGSLRPEGLGAAVDAAVIKR